MEDHPIDWDNPDIPTQFYALRREVIRLSLLVESLVKAAGQKAPAKAISKPGSKIRADAWKQILERHRQALEQTEPKTG